MPFVGANIYNRYNFEDKKCTTIAQNVHSWEKIPNLASLHSGKWL